MADQWDGCGSPWSLLYMDRVEWGPLISVFTKWWFTLQKASSFKVHILHLAPQGACFERAAQASASPVCPRWLRTVPIKDLVHRGFHDLLLVSLQWCNLPLASFCDQSLIKFWEYPVELHVEEWDQLHSFLKNEPELIFFFLFYFKIDFENRVG